MHAPVITLAAIVLIPAVLLMVLRVNAALVFLSLCLGDVLVQFVASDTANFLTLHANQVPQQAASASSNTIKIVLLLLPVVLTAVFMIRTVRDKGRLMLNVLPAAGVGLPHNIVGSSLWNQVTRAQDLIVGASALVCLLVLWLQRPKTGGSHKRGKH